MLLAATFNTRRYSVVPKNNQTPGIRADADGVRREQMRESACPSGKQSGPQL